MVKQILDVSAKKKSFKMCLLQVKSLQPIV